MVQIIKFIGSVAISIILMAIPILCGLSFGLHWDVFFRWLLTVFSILELFGIWALMYKIVQEEE